METDPGFPSGKWVGFYTFGPRSDPYRMDLFLQFDGERMTGEGIDNIGRFTIDGHYSIETRKCGWIKQYVGRHRVDYDGVQGGKAIGGMWTIRVHPSRVSRGGFRIWPATAGELTAEYFVEEEPATTTTAAEAVSVGVSPGLPSRLAGCVLAPPGRPDAGGAGPPHSLPVPGRP